MVDVVLVSLTCLVSTPRPFETETDELTSSLSLVFVHSISLVFQLAVTAIYPTFIQPLFNKFTALPEGPIREKVSALSKRLNFPLRHLYEIDGSKRSGHSNALVLYFFDASFVRAEALTTLRSFSATSTVSLGRSTSSSTTLSSRRARRRRSKPFWVSFDVFLSRFIIFFPSPFFDR